MQTAINPALAAAMTLEQAAQVGEFQPVTREGQPTVAAQLMQKAVPPAIPQIAQQAGLGAQIQNMQMQQAQQELMSRLMQQQKPAGIESLNPNIQGFADGGIVGYQAGGPTTGYAPVYQRARALGINLSPYDSPEERAEKLERLAKMEEGQKYVGTAEIPGQPQDVMDSAARAAGKRVLPQADYSNEGRNYPQQLAAMERFPNVPQESPAPTPPVSGGIAAPAVAAAGYRGLLDQAGKIIASMNRGPVAPAAGIEGALQYRQAMDNYRRQLGLAPEMEDISRRQQAMEDISGERERLVNERLKELKSEKGEQGLINFLLGARGFQGEGVGQTLKTGAQAARSYDEAVRGRMQGLEDLRLDVLSLREERRSALDKMRDDIARGDFKSAMDDKRRAQDAENELKRAQAELKIKEAEFASGEARARIQASRPPSEFERYISRLEQLSGKPFTAEQLRKEYADFRGAGRTGERDIQMQKLANDELNKFMTSIQYLNVINDPAKAKAVLEDKKRELQMQYPGAVFDAGAAKSGPTPGTVMDGYRFKGGDPSKQSNWEKV